MATALLLVAALVWAHQTWPPDTQRAADAALTPAPAGIVASVGRRTSHAGRYQAEVVSATPFAVGARQRWTVHLTRRGHRRAPGARLTVTTRAPETGEVSTRSASVRYVGGGRYRVDGIYFPRPGWWNVALVIDAAAGIDSLAFNVILPATSPTSADRAPRVAPITAAR